MPLEGGRQGSRASGDSEVEGAKLTHITAQTYGCANVLIGMDGNTVIP